MNDKTVEQKTRVIEAAIALYLAGTDHYTVKNICEKGEITQSEFYKLFGNKERVLWQFYPHCVDRYRVIITMMEDHDRMSLSEKLENFIFVMLDFFQEQRLFVEKTFGKMLAKRPAKTAFQKEVEDVFREILENENDVAFLQHTFLLNFLTYDILAGEFFSLVKFWLSDDSENYEKTMAYADKLISFLTEILEISIVDKGFDLAKFVLQNNLKNLPFYNWIFK